MSEAWTSSDEEAQEKAEQRRADWARWALVATFVVGTCALVAWHMIAERAGFSTAAYLVVQIVTTIGYGDVTPDDMWHRLLIAFYVLLALVVLAYLLNDFVSKFTAREEELIAQVLENTGSIDALREQLLDDRLSGQQKKFVKSTALFLSYIAFGTIFYGTYEACSCGYSETLIEGCNATSYKTCSEPGEGETQGQVKSYADAFYFSVITMTTVGFGDFTPMTVLGRYVGLFWMLTGVAITANWVGQLTSLFMENTEHKEQKKLIKKTSAFVDEVFSKMDYDGDGGLSKAEHHLYMLMKHNLLAPATLATLDKHFALLDGEKSTGLVTLEQIRERPNM